MYGKRHAMVVSFVKYFYPCVNEALFSNLHGLHITYKLSDTKSYHFMPR